MAQFMITVPDPVLTDLDALRLVMGVSRAEVVRQAALGKGLGALNRAHSGRLERLEKVALAHGHPNLEKYVEKLSQEAGNRGMPRLEELEGALANVKA